VGFFALANSTASFVGGIHQLASELLGHAAAIATIPQVLGVLESLHGDLELPAPIYSAKLISGKRLYKYAQAGESEVELPIVRSHIENIKFLSLENITCETKNLQLLSIQVSCSSGTYIRSMANYIGDLLNTKGVLYSLKRTKVGDFKIEDSTIIKFD